VISAVSDPTPNQPSPTPEPSEAERRSVTELVFDVSERTSALIREEIELAKAEVSEKVGKIMRGSAVGIAAGVFAFFALILAMEGFAWLLNEEVFDNSWAGFFVEAAIFVLIAVAAGLFAYRSVKAGAPPVPEQAIEEAKLIRTAIEGEEETGQGEGEKSPPRAGEPAQR
jgi:Putative Actinobacterial Holin-X, holin superfamily III